MWGGGCGEVWVSLFFVRFFFLLFSQPSLCCVCGLWWILRCRKTLERRRKCTKKKQEEEEEEEVGEIWVVCEKTTMTNKSKKARGKGAKNICTRGRRVGERGSGRGEENGQEQDKKKDNNDQEILFSRCRCFFFL